MSETNRPVTSREYKLMLNTVRFKERDKGSKVSLDLIAFLIKKEGGPSSRHRINRRDGEPATSIPLTWLCTGRDSH